MNNYTWHPSFDFVLRPAPLSFIGRNAATLQSTVVGISDGDTITVLDTANTTHKIRLSGIDAPEKKQPYGNASKQALSDMVYERTVNIEYEKNDRFGRKVGKVLVNGLDAT